MKGKVLLAALSAACMLSCSTAASSGYCPFAIVADAAGREHTNENSKPAGDAPESPPQFSKPSWCTPEEYDKIARGVVAALQTANIGPPELLRAAFHTSGTWSPVGQVGGPNGGWLQFSVDAEHGKNAGLWPLTQAFKLLKAQPGYKCITLADLMTLAGAVAVETAAGPSITWYPGRLDSLSPGPSSPAYSAALPDGAFSSAGITYWATNLGLTMREAVALIGGGHSIGGTHAENSGWNGVWTSTSNSWPSPKNQFLRDLIQLGWTTDMLLSTSRVQHVPTPGQQTNYTDADTGKQVARLPSDIALRTSSGLSYWTLAYAMNEGPFVHDFQRVFQRLLQFGAGKTWMPLTTYKWKGLKGDAPDFGTDIKPQSDIQDLPVGDTFDFTFQSLKEKLADPSIAVLIPLAL